MSDPAPAPGSAAWWAGRRELDARRRPRADGLTVERIVVAAVDLVDAEGLAALTVRRLADDLGTGSASLYRHVASRDELLVLMVDHVIGEVELPGEDVPGRRRVELLAHGLRRVLMDHASMLPALTAAPLLGPNALRGVEVGLASMLDAGYEPDLAVPAVLALIDFVLGTVYFDTSSAGRNVVVEPDEAAAESGVEELPVLRAHRGELRSSDVEDVFAFGLDTFLAGLERRS